MKPKFRSLAAAFAPLSRASLIVCASLCAAANADQTWTGATSTAWNTAGNWTSAVPTASDVAIFDATSTANLTIVGSGGNYNAKGLQVTSPSGAVSIGLTLANKVSALAVTADNTTDTFSYSTGTPLATGDVVTFGGTTMPTGIAAGVPYFVLNATATTFQVSRAPGGTVIDFTANGSAVNATGGTYDSLALGSSGIDMSAATQNLTIGASLTLSSAQTWNVASGMTLTTGGYVFGSGALTKSGAGTLVLQKAGNPTGNITVTGGQITTKDGSAMGLATLVLGNGTTFRYERTTGAATTFPGFPITVSSASSVTITTDNATNGYSGLISGDADSTVTIGATGATTQCSFSNGSSTQQFGSFLGRVEIFDGTSLRFSATSGVNNGGASAIWDNNTSGNITTRNAATVNLGSLVGAGTISGSSGANGTAVFSIGGRNEDCTYDGTIVDATAGSRIAAVTKVGTGILTLTNATGLTYGGTTTVSNGTLRINGAKTGTGANNINNGGTLAGTGSVAGLTTVANGGTIAPGSAGIGTLTCSNLTLANGSTLNLEFGSGNDKVTVASGGTLTLPASGANVNVNGFNTPGSYTIINTTGATVSGVAASAFTATGGDGSKVYTFSSTSSAIVLTISSSDPNNYWHVDGGGTWNAAGNWKNFVVPNGDGAIAKFGPGVDGTGGSFTSSFSVTLDGDRTVGLLSFNDDFGAALTIDPGTSTPGSLLLSNGTGPSNIVCVTGDHVINAPVVVNSFGAGVDVGVNLTNSTPYSLTVNGVVSGSGAVLTKTGGGKLILAGSNTYNGGTILAGGLLNVNSSTSLGNVSGALRFTGGTLQLGAALSGITRSYQVSGTSSAVIDTNGFDFGYAGVISPYSGGTGGLTKSGLGILTLSAAQTYTGTTAVNGGELALDAGSSISGSSVTSATAGGGLLHVLNGGSLTATTGNFGPQSGGLFVDSTSGLVTFSGGLVAMNTTSNGNSAPIRVAGSALSAASIQLGRTGLSITAEPTAAPINTNLYISGGAVNVSGDLIMGTSTGSSAPNSSVVTRVDGGTLTVGGTISVGLNNGSRWSCMDIHGGTLVSTATAVDSGVVLGGTLEGKSAFLMNSGTATVERIQFGRGAVNGTSLLNVIGGQLYVGSGGLVLGSTGVVSSEVRLSGGNIGAKASWSSSLPVNVTVASTITAADSLGAGQNITLTGVVGGAGGFTKTGAGTLTLGGANTYTGAVSVNAGALAITGDSSAATGAISVVSGATLSGNGNIGGNVTIASGGHHSLAVAAAPGSQVTRTITGTLTLDSGNILDLTTASTPTGGVYVLATATGGIVGTPTTVNLPSGVSGTLAINDNNLELTVVAGYSSWADTHAGSGAVNADYDGDGVSNGVEYFMNAAAGFTANPGLVGGTVTWPNGGNINSADYGTQFVVQTSTDLVTWTDVLAGDSHLTNSAGSVSYAVTGTGSRFVRLKVNPN